MTSVARSRTALVLGYSGVVIASPGSAQPQGYVRIGHQVGDIYASPQLHERLHAVASLPNVHAYWLDEWGPKERRTLTPRLGPDWPDIARSDEYDRLQRTWADIPDAGTWWKWWALLDWLDRSGPVERLIWCDPDLKAPVRPGSTESQADAVHARLRARGMQVHLLGTDASTGLTQLQVARIQLWAHRE